VEKLYYYFNPSVYPYFGGESPSAIYSEYIKEIVKCPICHKELQGKPMTQHLQQQHDIYE
jgi:hypothetical protein